MESTAVKTSVQRSRSPCPNSLAIFYERVVHLLLLAIATRGRPYGHGLAVALTVYGVKIYYVENFFGSFRQLLLNLISARAKPAVSRLH
jgi:hypothetical protein